MPRKQPRRTDHEATADPVLQPPPAPAAPPPGDYLSTSDEGFAHQLQTFAGAVGAYAAGLGVTPAQVTAQAADAAYFSYALQCQEIVQNASKQWTSWKDIQRRGGNVPPTGVPVVPVFPAAVPPVAPGIEVRFRTLVKQIKASADYNASIGQALGIEGTPQVGLDYATLAPVLGLSISGDRVNIDWGWQGYRAFLDQCELQVDRGDGKGMVLLAIDTTPGYADTQGFPGAPAKWTYQAIYRVDDDRVGQWSRPMSIMVGAG